MFTSAAPTVAVGDAVVVGGRAAEFRPGGSDSANLTTTGSPALGHRALLRQPLPAPTVVGIGGRVLPATVIDDDATGDVETSGSFDPRMDGIDLREPRGDARPPEQRGSPSDPGAPSGRSRWSGTGATAPACAPPAAG